MQQLLSLSVYHRAIHALLTPFYFLLEPKKMLLRLAMLVLSVGMMSGVAGQATLVTDQPDYMPGTTATLTGAGFQAGESIRMQVVHADGAPATGTDHDPWFVNADADGNFTTTWHVCEDDCLGSQLLATADGQSSTIHAEVLFTDALVVSTSTGGLWSSAGTWSRVARTGSITTSNSSITVTGSGTLFLSELAIGSIITRTNGAILGTVASITSNTSLTLTGNAASTQTAITFNAQIVPFSGDDVAIASGATVTVNGIFSCASLLINDGGNATANLDFAASGSPTLTVAGAVTIGNIGNANREGTLTFANGSTLIAGSLSLGAIATQTSSINMTSGGLLKVNGSISVFSGSTWTPGSGTLELTANNTLPSTILTSFNNLTVSSGITTLGAGPTTVNGTLNVSGTLANGGNSLAGTGNIVVNSGGSFRWNNQLIPAISGTKTFDANSTFEYYRNGNQNIAIYNYGHLVLSGTANQKLLQGNTTVNGNLTVNAASDLRNTGGAGRTITMTASAPTISVLGSITGTDIGPSNDINLDYSNTTGTLTVSGNGSLCRFLNASVSNSTATLALARNFEVMFGTFTMNGTLRIDNGGSVSSAANAVAPTYGNNSFLVYNTTFNTANEWTGGNSNNPVAGLGVPANVTILSGTVSLTANRGTPGNVLISGGQLNLGSGDLYLGGNFTHNASFINNGKAVFFVGNAATQTINASGGGVSFAYLIIDKPSGVVSLQNASFFIDVNGSAGNTLQLLNAGQLDLNGGTLNLNNNGGFIYVNGARTITSASAFGKVKINASKSVANNAGVGTLLFDANVRVELFNQMDFGFSAGSISTIAGELEIKNGGFVTTARAPFYATGSTLRYNSGGNYGAGEEWYPNSFGEVTGVPFHVEIAAGTSMNFGNANTARELRGNMTLGAGTNFYLSNVAGGDLKIKGNWINNGGTFFYNGRAVFFNGTGAQTISKTGGEIFGITILTKSSGSVDLLNDLRVDQLQFETGNTANINTASNTLFVFGNASTDVVRTGNGYVNGILKRNLGATGQNYLFPVGKTAYLPLTVHASSGTGELSSEAFETSIVGAVPANTTLFPNRQWNVSQVSGGPFTYNITLDGTGFTPGTSDAVIVKGDGANPLTSFPATANGNNYTANGITGFSFFALAAACDPPIITLANQPQSQTVCENQSVSFTVTATGTGVPSYTYKWYKTGNPVALSNGGNISGATSATLTINPVATADAGSFYVEVSRPCGTFTTSSAATLTVKEVPEVTTSPVDQTVTYGAAAGFTVVANGTGITYQWQEKIGAAPFANITDGGIYSGATTATLNLSRPTVAMSGRKYRVLVSGDCSPPAESGEATLVVSALEITGNFTADNKVYDGNTSAVVLTRTLNGVLAGDVANVTLTGGTATFSDKNVGNGKTVTLTGATLSGSEAGNYSLLSVGTTTANITALEITGNFTADNKVYDGNTSAVVLTRTLNGVLAGDVANVTLTGGTATFSDKNVGNGKTVTLTGATLSGSEAGNYSLLSVGTTTANITALEITGNFTADNKVYDGNTSAVVLTRTLNGVLAGDVANVTLTGGTATFSDKNVGNGKTVTLTGATLSGSEAGNYSLLSVGTTTANITALEITGNFTADNKVYDGNTSAVVLTRTLNGVLAGDVANVTLTGGTATFSDKNVGNGKTVTLTGATLSGSEAGNYSLLSVGTTTANITALEITGNFTADNKVYDGNTSAVVLTRTLNGVLAGDVANVTLTGGTATFSDKNVGNGKTVTLTGATLSGSEAGNYNLVSVNTTLADINQKQITVALIGTVTKMYDANNIATLVTGNYSLPGIIGTDDVVLNNPTSGLYNNKHVGTGKNVVVTGLSISGADAGNYALTSTSANANIGVITIRPVNVTAQTDSRIYNGTNSSSVSPVGEALQGSDTYTTLGTQTYNNKHVASGKIMIATGAVINDGNGGLNYSITYVTNNTGVIIVKPINVTAQTDNRMYNGTNSSSVSPVGDALQTGDSYTTQGTQTYNDKHVATGKTMTATGTIINDGNSGNNYFITYVTNTTGVITIRPITVTAITNTKVYDGNTSALAVPTFPPLQTGDVVSTQPTEVYDNPLVGTGKTMTASGLMINDGNGGNNYSISYVQNFTGVINLASTTTTLTTSAGVVRFMDYLTMTATIKPLNTGTPLTGTVEFKIGTVSYGSATVVPIPGATDGSVQAMMIKQVTNMPLASPGYTVTATFTSSNTNYAGSNDSKQLTVNPRNASPNNASGFYTGDGFAWTTGPNTSTATVTMTAVIKDPNSPTGDVRGAKASFFLVNGTTMSPISSAQNLPVGLIDVTDGSVGSASAIVQLNIGSLNSNSFQIAVKITGAYTNNPWDALSQTIVTVSKPVTGGYICGGSTMKNTSSSGYIKGATDLNTDFQFDIQYNSSGTNPKGKVNVLVRSYYDRFGILDSKLHKYFIKTSAIALLAISNPLATGTFSAKANMEEQLDDGTVISVESGATFQMVAFQNGCTQQIAITYHRKAGGIWFSSKWNAATSKTELQNVNTGSKVYVAGGGSCSVASRTNGLANSTQVDVIPQTADLQFNVKVFGNPTLSTFKLQLQSSNTTEKITVKVYDINGRVVELRQQLLAGQMIELGSAYKQGTYFAEVIQGDQRKVVKLIKTAQN